MSRSTPWGQSQSQKTIAPGIVRYDTASHGGYHVAPERMPELPPELSRFRPFSGRPGWFEEDCDWCVVALSFPQYFTPAQIRAAVVTARTSYASKPSGIINAGDLYEVNAAALSGFLESERGRALVKVAEDWERENAAFYEPGSAMGGAGIKGWIVSAYRVDGKERISFEIDSEAYYRLPHPFRLEYLEQHGARNLKRAPA